MRISDCSSDVCSSDLHLCPEKENDVFTVLDLFAVSFEKTRRLRSEFGYLGFYGMRCAGALATRVPDTLFDGPDGKTRNKTIQEKVVQNGDGYAYDQAGAHQRSPKIDIAPDQKGRNPDTGRESGRKSGCK